MDEARGVIEVIAAILMAVAVQSMAGPTAPSRGSDTCVTADCHADILARKVLHGPVAQLKCQACHRSVSEAGHRFTLTVQKPALCTSCHVQTRRTHVHGAVAEGNCTGCHDPHGSDHRYMMVEDPAAGLCFRCHAREDFTGKAHVHGPVAAGACIVCHEPHSSWQPNLLTRQKEELCLVCHADVQANLKLSRYPHPPVAEGRCLACHEAHASDYPAQLRQPPDSLCVSCHEHRDIQRLIETSQHVHGAIKSEKGCAACHSGHGGSLPKLLAEPLMNLCLSCHDRPQITPDGKRLANMAAMLANNPDHHGPVRRADCVACHNPHASPNFRLLAKEYPDMFYAPFDLQNYDLCFTCHVQELVTQERGGGVTGFRQGDVNLHYVHVHKEEKGRTCRACHEVHASQRPFHIREKVPFGTGGWEMEINFERQPDGGRCAPGCHEEKGYSRGGAEERS